MSNLITSVLFIFYINFSDEILLTKYLKYIFVFVSRALSFFFLNK